MTCLFATGHLKTGVSEAGLGSELPFLVASRAATERAAGDDRDVCSPCPGPGSRPGGAENVHAASAAGLAAAFDISFRLN